MAIIWMLYAKNTNSKVRMVVSIRRDHLFSALRNRLEDNTQPFNQSEAALLPIVRVFVEGF